MKSCACQERLKIVSVHFACVGFEALRIVHLGMLARRPGRRGAIEAVPRWPH